VSEGTAALAVLALFAVAFPAIWLGVTALLAEFGGWNRLQRAFPDQPNASVIKSLGFRSARFGHPLFGVSYSGVLTFDVCDIGLRIRVWKLFAMFSRPIFLPWDSFRTERYQWFIWDACRMRWGQRDRDSMIIYRRLAEAIAVASDGKFGAPDQGE